MNPRRFKPDFYRPGALGRSIAIAVVLLALLAPAQSLLFAAAQDRPCVWTNVEKIVAIGDIHGDYKNFTKILFDLKLIDLKGRWTGGKTHLVQTGDILDRGDYAKDIFDLLIALEKEAEAAGGQIHFLLGNHEEMNLTGVVMQNLDYITVPQFRAFLPEAYRKKQEDKLKKRGLKENDENFWLDLMAEPSAQEEYTKGLNETYGKWLIGHNIIEKINDVVFVHGGISRTDSQKKIEDLNIAYRKELEKVIRYGDDGRTKMVYAPGSPLWNRQLATQNEADYMSAVDTILTNLGAKAIVIAHTPKVIEKDQSRFGGKVWIVDTGISSVYRQEGGHMSALIIQNGNFQVWGNSHGSNNDRIDRYSFFGPGLVFWNRPKGAFGTG